MREQDRTQITPQHIGLAGCGDLAALRRLRDYWLALMTGDETNQLLPRDDVIPQAEMLAEITAAATGETRDWTVLLIAYQMRAEIFARNLSASEDFEKQAVEAGNAADVERWSSTTAEFRERLDYYQRNIAVLLGRILESEDIDGATVLVRALLDQADGGDEHSATVLNSIIDSVPPEKAAAIQAEVRRRRREEA